MNARCWTRVLLTGCLASVLWLNAAAASVDDKAHQQGMAKAPALLKTLNLSCTLVDARKLPARRLPMMPLDGNGPPGGMGGMGGGMPGGGGMGDDVSGGEMGGGGGGGMGGGGMGGAQPLAGRGGPQMQGTLAPDEYEVACTEGLGYVLTAAQGKQAASLRLCIESIAPPPPPGPVPGAGSMPAPAALPAMASECQLPANLPAAQRDTVARWLATTQVPCHFGQWRATGHTKTNTLIEVSCEGNAGTGYLLLAAYPPQPNQQIKAVPCIGIAADSQVHCVLSNSAAMFATAEALFTKARAQCKVAQRRYMTMTDNGDYFFEYRCENNQGFILQQKADGSLGGTAACTEAVVNQLGGCKLGQAAPT